MASRRDSLQKLDKKLKDLMRQAPEGKELFQILFGISDNRPHANLIELKAADRTIAVTAAAFLDHALQKAICTHLPLSANHKDLFDDRGPLGTLSAKIIMAKALEIIDTVEREDLDTIRTIRNSFAHTLLPIGFDADEVKTLCKTLRVSSGGILPGIESAANPAKQQFAYRVTFLFYILFKYDPKKRLKAIAAALIQPSPDKSK